jgi:hypothetical protein
MRRVLVLVAAAVAVVAMAACEPTPPTVAMTVKSVPAKPACGTVAQLVGNTGGTKASSVVLQRTSGGKWVDWKWVDSWDSQDPHLLTARPNSAGDYKLSWLAPTKRGTYHLRVRSAGGSVVSNDIYVSTFEEIPGDCD